MLRKRIIVSFLLAVMAVPLIASAGETLTGKVVSIADGDTLTLLVDREQVKVRLEGIDAPEKGQPYGDKARQELGRLVFGKAVKVETTGKDRYGRTLGRVFVDADGQALDASRHLVAAGLAWHYVKYSKDAGLAAAEREARAKRRGLWADPSPVAPWDWRKGER